MPDDYEKLDLTGINITAQGIAIAVLTADFGDGYGAGALVGSEEGIRTWTIEADVLPDLEDYLVFPTDASPGETRADYLWNFFIRSKIAGNRPFRFVEPKNGLEYFAEFVDHNLSYNSFTAKLYSARLEIRQRRVRDFESPGDAGDNPLEI